jgi:nitroimidazol reductase NimA-like FMN-containing flavoprotein (pyridoxamine 5'-phosphate oxidase superfamily)
MATVRATVGSGAGGGDMGRERMTIKVAKFRDIADGLQPGQFQVGDREAVQRLDELDPMYRQLMDEPVTAVLAVIGDTGRANLTPVWFDYEGNTVLLNLAAHRKKVDWLRKRPQATFLLMNPQNAYHWMSIKATVVREISEDDPEEGARVSAQLNKIFDKYVGGDTYTLRDPSIDERRILFELDVDAVATFGRP